MLDWNKRKIKPCKFANLPTPEATCVDHPDIVLIFIGRLGFDPHYKILRKDIWGG